MRDRLVVGFDASEAATRAAMWAAEEAVDRHAVLEVVASYPLAIAYDPAAAFVPAGPEVDAFREACEVELDRVVTHIRIAQPTLKVEQLMTVQLPVDALVEASQRADLVVVGNARHGMLHSLLLGSVAHAVTRRSHCPVVIVRQAAAVRRGTVVVGVDGSAAADLALEWAVDEADRRGATLRVLHAWEPVYDDMSTTTRTLRDLAEVDAACTLDRSVEHATARGGCTIERVLVKDLPDHALLEASRDADLLVVGTRGHGEAKARVLGSVARAVTQIATSPVVVVPTPHAG